MNLTKEDIPDERIGFLRGEDKGKMGESQGLGGDGLRDQVLKLVKRMLGKVLVDVGDINGANFGEVTGMVVIVGTYWRNMVGWRI